jgi:hypothetical protein
LRLPVLVPFWKPPNITESTMRIRINSTAHIRHPPARDRGRHRLRGPLDRSPYSSPRLDLDLMPLVCPGTAQYAG